MTTFVALAFVLSLALGAPLSGNNLQNIGNVQNIVSINNVNVMANSIHGPEDDDDAAEGGISLGDILANLKSNGADVQPMPVLPDLSNFEADVLNSQNINSVQNIVSINNVNTLANEVEGSADRSKAQLKAIMDNLVKLPKSTVASDEKALAKGVDVEVNNLQNILNTVNAVSINNVNTISNDIEDLNNLLHEINKVPDLKKALVASKAAKEEDNGDVSIDVTNLQNIANVLNILSINNVNTIANEVDNEEQLEALMEIVGEFIPDGQSSPKTEAQGTDIDFVNAQNLVNVRNIVSLNNVNTIANEVEH